ARAGARCRQGFRALISGHANLPACEGTAILPRLTEVDLEYIAELAAPAALDRRTGPRRPPVDPVPRRPRIRGSAVRALRPACRRAVESARGTAEASRRRRVAGLP